MKEEPITLPTAKLAKDKAFDWPVEDFYPTRGNFPTNSEGYQTERIVSSNWNDGQGNYPTRADEVICSAPSQSLLQKWIREKYNIDIVVIPESNVIQEKYYWYMIFMGGKEVYDWQKRFGDILTKAEQDIEGDHLNDELFNKFLYEDNFAFKTYEEALEFALQEVLKLIPNKE